MSGSEYGCDQLNADKLADVFRCNKNSCYCSSTDDIVTGGSLHTVQQGGTVKGVPTDQPWKYNNSTVNGQSNNHNILIQLIRQFCADERVESSTKQRIPEPKFTVGKF